MNAGHRFSHRGCGGEVVCESRVFEYAPIIELFHDTPMADEPTSSVVEETSLYCEDCGVKISVTELIDTETEKPND